MSAYLRILVTGKSGRMGQTIIACAQRDPEVDVVATHDVGEALAPALEPADTVIDFTIHASKTRRDSICNLICINSLSCFLCDH